MIRRAPGSRLLTALASALLLTASSATAEELAPPDWSAHAETETVIVVNADEDGTARETTVWLAVLDGQAYVRTGGSQWGANLQRNPEFSLRVGETELNLRVAFVEDDTIRASVAAAFREKYGFPDAVMDLFRGDRPLIMRLDPREPSGA